MKFKNVYLYSYLFTALITNNLYTMWKPAGTEAIKDADEMLTKQIPAVKDALSAVVNDIAKTTPNIGINTVKELGKIAASLALKTENVANAIVQAAPNVRANAANAIAQALPNVGLNAANAVAQAAPNIGVNTITKVDESIKDNMPALKDALAGTGEKAFMGAITTIGSGLMKTGVTLGGAATKVLVFGKVASTAIITAPAAPYIAAGVVATYGGYKVYRYYKPTPEQITLNAQIEAAKINAQNILARTQQEQKK